MSQIREITGALLAVAPSVMALVPFIDDAMKGYLVSPEKARDAMDAVREAVALETAKLDEASRESLMVELSRVFQLRPIEGAHVADATEAPQPVPLTVAEPVK